jgi:pyridinium-3,5-bisthiocarboxylic acid mononucleotide nickel chelatase
MKTAYFDCFSGASGDMILGALVGAGLSPDVLRAELGKLPVHDYELDIRPIVKQGFAATKVDVNVTGQHGHRHLGDITAIIDGSTLMPTVKDRAKRIFTRLAESEAQVHGTTPDKVHFHEVGAVDAIVDIVGACIGVEQLGLTRIVCSPIPVGSGTVRCDHGVMPVPAPATALLLAGVPLAECEEIGELTTPTGAAILTTLAERFGSMPAMTVNRCGSGAGTREGKTRANILRLFVGEEVAQAGGAGADDDLADEVVVLEANIDDATGEQIGYCYEALFAAGALDVFTTPVIMKKNRPGVQLSVLAPRDRQRACEDVLFAETTTFGVRSHVCRRRKLERSIKKVATPFGEIRVKIGRRGGRVIIASPEYDDCASAAREHGVPLREVMDAAKSAIRA